MITRALLVALLATGIGLSTGASATPYAGQYRYLYAEAVSITGADGAIWRLTVAGTKSGAAESRQEQNLYVDLDRCSGGVCKKVGRWVKPLATAEVSIEGSMLPSYSPTGAPAGSNLGRLRTTLGQTPLRIDLMDDNQGGGVSGTGLSRAAVYVETTRNASGTLRLGAATCRLTRPHSGMGEVSFAFDPVGDDARDPRTPLPTRMPAGFIGNGRALRC